MAQTDKALLWLALLLAMLGLLIGIDLLSATGADACPAPNCYPWGTEGPAADDWRYESKHVYVASGLASFALPLLAVIAHVHGSSGGRSLSNARRIVIAVLLVASAGLALS